MKQRAVEILFKHKLLILSPLFIVLPLSIVLASRPRPKQYQTFATVWVDQYRPLYQDDRLGYTPASNQATLMNNFFHTREFALAVMRGTQLGQELDGEDAQDRAVQLLWQSVSVWPTSNDFIVIAVQMPSAELAYETAQGIIAQYQTVLRARMETQAKAAQAVYADQLTQADQKLAKSRQDLASYLASHPELVNRRLDSSTLESQDPALARLNTQVSSDLAAYQSTLDRYQYLKSVADAGLEGQQLAFSVVDEPRMPRGPVRLSRLALIKIPAIGLILGLMLSAVIAVFLVITNRSVLSPQDVRGGLELPLLGEVPQLRRRLRPWQRAPRDAVRLRVSAPATEMPLASGSSSMPRRLA